MIVDEHIHLGGLFQNTDYLIESLDEAGIDSVLAVPYMFEDRDIPKVLKMKKIPPALAGTKVAMNLVSRVMSSKRFGRKYISKLPNDYVAEMAKKYPERIYGVYWVNPNNEEMAQMEKYLQNKEYVGVKLHQVLYPCVPDQKFLQVFDIADEYKVPVFIHTANKEEMKTIISHVEKKPDLNVILAHMGFYEEMAHEISSFPNLHLDISPLYAQKDEQIMDAIEHVGVDRIIFGTDSPCPGTQKYAVERVKKLKIPEEDKEKILGKNIMTLINKRATLEN